MAYLSDIYCLLKALEDSLMNDLKYVIACRILTRYWYNHTNINFWSK